MELKLYVEDFSKLTDWYAICRHLGLSIHSEVITMQVNQATGEQE